MVRACFSDKDTNNLFSIEQLQGKKTSAILGGFSGFNSMATGI
jgi:hypothetical protein